jgi:hypothetical protein
MWKIDTRINLPVTRQIKLSIIDKAWDRVAIVGNSWAIKKIKRIPKQNLSAKHDLVNIVAIA